MNLSCLTGHVGRDPEVHSFPNGDRVVRVALGVHRFVPGENGTGGQTKTEWFRIHFYGPSSGGVAERALKSVSKGSLIAVKGTLRSRTLHEADGSKHNIVFLEVRSQDGLDILYPSHASGRDPSAYGSPAPAPASIEDNMDFPARRPGIPSIEVPLSPVPGSAQAMPDSPFPDDTGLNLDQAFFEVQWNRPDQE